MIAEFDTSTIEESLKYAQEALDAAKAKNNLDIAAAKSNCRTGKSTAGIHRGC